MGTGKYALVHKPSGAEESKFCSRKCKDAYHVSTGEFVARREAFATIPNKCFHCDAIDDILLHHIDHDHFNNDPSNWRIVCRRCHIMIEHPENIYGRNHKVLSLAGNGLKS